MPSPKERLLRILLLKDHLANVQMVKKVCLNAGLERQKTARCGDRDHWLPIDRHRVALPFDQLPLAIALFLDAAALAVLGNTLVARA